MDQLLSWVVFPIAAVAICFGIGALAARVARVELAPALLPALGFATAIAVLGIVFATGIGAVPVFVLLVVLALGGLVPRIRGVTPRQAGDSSIPRPGLGALTGAAAFLLHIAPEALTGKATFLGYNLLNDTAIHLALVDWIGDHGSRYIRQPSGSFGATINDYVESRYPLGSHELLAALKPVVGLDPALLYQPFLALCAGIAAAAIYAVLRPSLRPAVAAVAGFAAMASQLVFSFALQGSIKEFGFMVCLAAAAGIGAELRHGSEAATTIHMDRAGRAAWMHPVGLAALFALPSIALYGIYGVYALPWIVPLALLALILARPPLRAIATGLATFLVGVAVLVPDSIHYYNHGHNVITSGTELGPLAGPLKPIQVAGIWLGGDYRFTPAHAGITYALALAVIVAAIIGLAVALRRRDPAVLLLLVPALVAALVTSPSSSPYIDAKLLAILSPFVVATAAFGLASIPPKRFALALAVVLGVALLVSDALAYRMALPAPMDRLGELQHIDAMYAGRGPMLVNEFEEYVKHFMRRARGSDPYETWTGGRAQLRDPSLPVAGHEYDLAQMRPAFVERWRYIVLRQSPVASRPPANYRLAWSGRWYQVWQRNGPAAARPVRRCQLPIAVPRAAGEALPPGWYAYGPDPSQLELHKGGSLRLTPGRWTGAVTFWLRGTTTRADRLLVDGRSYPIPRSAQRRDQWIRIATVAGGAAPRSIVFERPNGSLRPGDAQPDVVAPLVAASASNHCG